MRASACWRERMTGAYMSYWLYQHLGNLAPAELAEDELYAQVRSAPDPGAILREFAYRADHEAAGTRWSYHRDLVGTRLVVLDSRGGRVLTDDRREMVDDDEWDWIVEKAHG